MTVDGIIYNATIATFDEQVSAPYGMIENAFLAWRDKKIVAVGDNIDMQAFNAKYELDAHGKLITPGFVDCHTHLVYGGDRAKEFEFRLQGKSYQAIANEGGGIMSTVNASRSTSEDNLYNIAISRIKRLQQSGVTSLEIKSGYGLNFESEIKLLRVIQRIKQDSPLNIIATCLAAHAVPKDFSGTKDDYIQWVCEELLPEIKQLGLADAVDIFCESIAFSQQHAQQLFSAATSLGLPIKGHVEQLSQSQGTDIVCQYNGLSADHLEYADEHQVKKMKASGVIPVLLPGAYYYLNEKQKPPIQYIRKYNLPVAIATDLNPGSSPIFSILTAANMACVLFGLTPEEALKGITINGAKALRVNSKGVIQKNSDADFILWPITNPCELVYETPAVLPNKTWIAGHQQEI